MHIRCLFQLPMLALALTVSSYVFAKDEAKIILPPAFSQNSPSQQKTCENKLDFSAFQPQWKMLLPEFARSELVYAFGSKTNGYHVLDAEMAKEAAEQGLAIDYDSAHADFTISYIDRKDSRVAPQVKARIPLKEPFSKIEYFSAGNTSGFIAIVGWTRVHYYEFRSGKVTECEESDLHEFNPAWEVGLFPLTFESVHTSDREVEITDSRGLKAYLSRKNAKNLVDEMGMTSIEFLASHPISITMKEPRFPGQHAIDFYRSWHKAHRSPINKFSDIFTKAAMDVAQLMSPDMSEFFGPMVDLAFIYAFRTADLGQHFVNEFTKVVVQASVGTVRPVARFHPIPGDRDIAMFQDPSGAKYLLRYQPFSVSPLRLERVP